MSIFSFKNAKKQAGYFGILATLTLGITVASGQVTALLGVLSVAAFGGAIFSIPLGVLLLYHGIQMMRKTKEGDSIMWGAILTGIACLILFTCIGTLIGASVMVMGPAIGAIAGAAFAVFLASILVISFQLNHTKKSDAETKAALNIAENDNDALFGTAQRKHPLPVAAIPLPVKQPDSTPIQTQIETNADSNLEEDGAQKSCLDFLFR